MTSFIKQKTATFSRPRIIVKYMDTVLTSKPLTTATPVDGYAIVDGDIVLFTNLSAINFTIHRATVTGVNITWTQLALGQSADGLPALGDEVFIQAGTYTKKIYWYDNTVPGFVEFKSSGGIGDSSIFGYLNSQDDNITTQAFTTGNNATFLTAGVLVGTFNQKNETLPLNGKSSYTYTQGALNDWIASYAISVPLKAQGVTNVTKFSYMYNGNNGDIQPIVYDVTNSKILSSTTKYLETATVAKRCELVYDVPSTCSSIKIGFHVKVLNAGKVLKFDDIETGVWTPQAVNLVEQESVTYTGYTSKDGGSRVLFATKDTSRSNEKNIVQVDTTATTYTKYKILKACNVTVTAGTSQSSGTQAFNISHYDLNDNRPKYATFSTTSLGEIASLTTRALPGDYFLVSTGFTPNNDVSSHFSITASAISENVVQSWQPSDFLGEIKLLPSTTAPRGFIPADGKSIGKTSGNYQGDAYYDLYKVLWTQSSVTAGEPYVISSAKGADAATDWMANKTITIDVSGLVVRAYKSGTTAAVGAKQLDAFQGHWHQLPFNTDVKFASGGTIANVNTSAGARLYYSAQDLVAGNIIADGTNGTPRTSSETRMTNIAQYAFIRYGNDAPTLLALPVSKENRFTFSVSSTGVVTNNQNGLVIGNAVVSDTSLYTITLTSGIFANAPIAKAIAVNTDNRTATIISATTTQIVVRTGTQHPTLAFVKAVSDFVVELVRSSDYTAPGVFVGNVAKNQVAFVSDVKASGTNGGASVSGAFYTRDLNTVEGDTSIVSVSGNQFTLQAGEYEIEWTSPFYKSDMVQTRLYNVSDAQVMAYSANTNSGSTVISECISIGKTKIVLTAAKTLSIQYRTYSSFASTGLGNSTAFGTIEKYTQVKITKLNGQ